MFCVFKKLTTKLFWFHQCLVVSWNMLKKKRKETVLSFLEEKKRILRNGAFLKKIILMVRFFSEQHLKKKKNKKKKEEPLKKKGCLFQDPLKQTGSFLKNRSSSSLKNRSSSSLKNRSKKDKLFLNQKRSCSNKIKKRAAIITTNNFLFICFKKGK